MRDTFSNRLKKALHIRGLKQVELAEKMQINRGTISNYMRDKYEPNRDRIDQIAKILRVNPMWLLGYNVDMNIPVKNAHSLLSKEELKIIAEENKIPYTKIEYINQTLNCSSPDVDILDDEEHKTIIMSDNLLTGINKSHLMLARITGDSMNEIIPEGSLVLIQKVVPYDFIHDNDIVLYRYGNSLSIKEFIRKEDRLILRPRSTNPVHKDNVYTFESLAEEGADQVQILGIVKKVMYDV